MQEKKNVLQKFGFSGILQYRVAQSHRRGLIMNARKAVYAASLDPITNGHLNIIERMAPHYDELIVLVAVDPRKKYTFSVAERLSMTKAAVEQLLHVTVDACVGQYVVKYADKVGAQVIIRGLRNFKDLEAEQTLAEENRRICAHIETIWVPCLPHLMHVSSSMVKGHVGSDPGWEEQVARSVPEAVVCKLKEKFILEKACQYWATLMLTLGNPENSQTVLEDLLTRYSEKHRGHHVLEHIVTMLDEFVEFITQLHVEKSDVSPLMFAIWFHDAVYDPKAKDNEEQSAVLAKDAIKKMGLPDALGERTSALVAQTKHTDAPDGHTARVLVDLDLAILGKSEKVFNAYETGIRKEYRWVPWLEYCSRRGAILQSFLGRDTIYSTEFFRDKYEGTARRNLEQSILQLMK